MPLSIIVTATPSISSTPWPEGSSAPQEELLRPLHGLLQALKR